jgi:type 1 glutamine amidotransferase
MVRLLLAGVVVGALAVSVNAAETKIVLIAGGPSHGPGTHEHRAGMQLLAKCLEALPHVKALVVENGWPAAADEAAVFKDAKTVAFFMDGGGGHPLLRDKRMETMKRLMADGVGLVCIHYTVEVPKGAPADLMLEWLGGYYESGYSRNPINTVEVVPVAKEHPVSRGLKPLVMKDEFYYQIRFRPDDTRVTNLLRMTPEEKDKPDAGEQTIAWATVRANGGRSFGFTGGHFHTNWGVPEFRRLVLNALVWSAKLEVPEGGVQSTVADEDLKKGVEKK